MRVKLNKGPNWKQSRSLKMEIGEHSGRKAPKILRVTVREAAQYASHRLCRGLFRQLDRLCCCCVWQLEKHCCFEAETRSMNSNFNLDQNQVTKFRMCTDWTNFDPAYQRQHPSLFSRDMEMWPLTNVKSTSLGSLILPISKFNVPFITMIPLY